MVFDRVCWGGGHEGMRGCSGWGWDLGVGKGRTVAGVVGMMGGRRDEAQAL